MKCLVTGGAGFIGSNIARMLLDKGHETVILDNLSTGKRENLEGLEESVLLEGDVCDDEIASRAVAGVELVFHQAAIPSVSRSIDDPMLTNRNNVAGSLHILEAARKAGVRRVVYAASSSVYGDAPTLPKVETMPPACLSPYALQKYASERYMQLYYELYGLETVCLRYFNVFGPYQDPHSEYSAVIPLFISSLLDGKAPVVYGDGEQSRDFTYIANVVHANWLAAMADPEACGHSYNVGCGERISLNNLLEKMGEMMSVPVSARHEQARQGDVKHSLADITLADEKLGYKPVATFDEGLAETVSWFSGRAKGEK